MKLSLKEIKKLTESYDFITRAHVENVASLAKAAKNVLALEETEAKLLESIAWLHDLGKSINYDYISIILTPRKLEYGDENLHKLMIEHSSQSENKLDELGYKMPIILRLAIRNHHRFLISDGENRDLLAADPDFDQLIHEKKELIVRLLDIFMVIDFLCAYTEASRPSNWFDNISFNREEIIATIKKRYGDLFKIDLEDVVRKILKDPDSISILEKNTHHNPEIIAQAIKEWAEKTSIYDVNYVNILLGQITILKEDSDLTGFKKFLTVLTSPVFSVILWEKWAEEVFTEIITASLSNKHISEEIRKHFIGIINEHPHSMFADVISQVTDLKRQE